MWGLAAGFYLVALFHRMSLGVASIEAHDRLGLGPDAIALLSALQLGLYLLMTIPAGLAADRIGPRRALAGGLILMAAGETIFGLAHDPAVALAGRGLVGVGDAFIFLSVLRLAQSWFPPSRYAVMACLTGLAGALGQIGTTVPLGAALDGLGWTSTFVATGVVTGVLAAACLWLVRDRPGAAADPRPAAAPAHGIVRTLRLAWATRATRHGFWTHLALMGPFVAVTALWGIPWLVRAQGVDAASARALVMLAVISFAAAAPVAGLVVARRPAWRMPVLTTLAGAQALAWAAALLWPADATPRTLIAVALCLTGAAGGASMLAFDIAREGNPAERGGSATGLANTGGFLAAVGVQLAVAGILRLQGGGGDLQEALLVLPLLSVVGLAQMTRHARRARVAAGRPQEAVGTA
ncbi:MAG: nitrate/nitrite transporter [Thermoleophilia bacterium]